MVVNHFLFVYPVTLPGFLKLAVLYAKVGQIFSSNEYHSISSSVVFTQ